ncbi:hypothetical protein L7F22_055676 [Adiantum nelumboides]|nr:hypothetical protein [Adiantum nelumboides]
MRGSDGGAVCKGWMIEKGKQLEVRVAWSVHFRKVKTFASAADQLSADRLQLSISWKRVVAAERIVVDLGEVGKEQVVNKVHLAGSAGGTYDALMASSSSVADSFLDVDVALEEQRGGGLFPADTLMGMLRCFGRLVKKEQDLRIAGSGISEVLFDIARNPIFESTQSLVLAAMRRSVAGGVCKNRKKASVIGVTLEEEILCDIDFSLLHGRGFQMRFAFYCLLHFSMRGGLELYKLERAMFSRGSDELGPFVRFCDRSSKNYKVDLNHFQPEHFRSPITVRDADILAAYNQLMRHMPAVVEGDKNLAFMFLQPISNPRTEVWFNRNRVSLKSLSSLVKSIGEKSGVAGNFSNKSLRNTCVTRMSLWQVPCEVGMLVTCHKQVSSYDKYDMSSEVRMAAAQDILSQPYDESGKLKNYAHVLEQKFSNFCENVEGIGSIGK